MRFADFPDFSKLLVLPSDPILNIIIILGFSLLVFLTLFFYMLSKNDVPGKQMSLAMTRMAKIDNKMWYKAQNAKKNSDRDASRISKRNKLDIQLKRLRMDYTAEEFMKIKNTSMMNGIFNLVVLLGMTFVLSTVAGTFKGWLETPVLILGLIITIVLGGYSMMYYDIQFNRKLKQLNSDILYDLYYFMSMYKYTNLDKGVFAAISDNLANSNSLRVDFEMVLSDLASMDIPTALDRFTERANLQELKRFSALIKQSHLTPVSPEQFKMSIQSLSEELKEKVIESDRRILKRKFNAILIALTASGVGMLILFTTQPLIEILLNFSSL